MVGKKQIRALWGIGSNICQMSVWRADMTLFLLSQPSNYIFKWLFSQYCVKGTICPFLLILQFSKLTEVTNFVTKMVTLVVHLCLFSTCGFSQLLCLRQVLTIVIVWWEYLETPAQLGWQMSSSGSHELACGKERSIWKPSSPWSHLDFLFLLLLSVENSALSVSAKPVLLALSYIHIPAL